MAAKPSHFIWYELMTSDLDAAARFYGAVVGWAVQPAGTPGMDYRQWSKDGVTVGGLMNAPPDASGAAMAPTWMGYLDVPDVDAAVERIKAAGGEAWMPPTDIPGVGRIATVTDPQGAAFYVMAPIGEGESQSFSPGSNGHGGWNELHTSDQAAGFAFYAKHFGWGKSDEFDMGPMGTYLLFNTGGDAVGGMMSSPNVPRPTWLYYFNVDDIHAAKARVEAAGGSVVNGPHQVPGGNWVLQAQDPQGAMFALVAP